MRDLDDYRLTPPEPDLFGSETTDMALFVRTSGDEVVTWDRSRIVEALIRETFIDRATADAISLEVEKTITAVINRHLPDASVSGDQFNAVEDRLKAEFSDIQNVLVRSVNEQAG